MKHDRTDAMGSEAVAPAIAPDRNSPTPPVELPRSPLVRALPALWYRRSVRAQLLITFVLIDLVAALVAGGVTILRARSATRIEIAASTRLAELVVSESISLLRQEAATEGLLARLPSQLRFLRHVRILVRDAAGLPVSASPGARDAPRADERGGAPAWFASLIAPPVERHEVPVTAAGRRIGSVLVVGEPADEIAEVWENTLALGGAALAVNLAVIAILYVLFGRVLDPLTGLARGLLDLERRNYRVRLARPRARELAAITDRFNALAAALDVARAENDSLNRRLITAQDDERRRTARELHDEVGPCLFGLKANATSIATVVGDAPEAAGVRERVGDMLEIIEQLQMVNRSLLSRLRPMALGHVPLADLLADMVRERSRQHPHIDFSFSAGRLATGYGDSIDLTIYRCVQESLTNAIRHASARSVAVTLGEADADVGEADAGGHNPDAASLLRLCVRDDGCGIAPGASEGFGLTGMRERVQALGGDFALESAGRGTCVRIAMPARTEHDGPGDAGGAAP